MKHKKQYVEEWLPVLPKFNEEQLRKLYFLMEDYAKDYHKNKVNELDTGAVDRSFSLGELHALWQFANAQFQLIKAQQEKSSNYIERRCLSFAANCIVDIMDEIAEMLETDKREKTTESSTKKTLSIADVIDMLPDDRDISEIMMRDTMVSSTKKVDGAKWLKSYLKRQLLKGN